MLYINEPNISTNINRARQFFATERESWRSNHINLCKVSQNRKSYSFYTFWPKKTHISRCKIVHLYIIATVTVHICTVTIALVFNILMIFSLSLSLDFGNSPFSFPHFFSHLTPPFLILSLGFTVSVTLPFLIWSKHFHHQTTPRQSSNEALSPFLFLYFSLKIGFGWVGMWVVLGLWGRG